MSFYAHAVWAAIAVVCLVLGVAYERHEGAKGCTSADLQASAAQQVQNATHEAHASDATQAIQEKLDAEKHAAPDADAPHSFVCPPATAPRPRAVLPPAGATSAADAAPAVPAAPARDIGPAVDTTGRDADAQVNALQHYITDVCLAR